MCSMICVKNGKAVPLQAWSGPEGSRKLRFPDYVAMTQDSGLEWPRGFQEVKSFPDYMTMAQDGGKVVSLTHRPHLPPRKCSWHSFLLEAESTPGP